MLKNIKADIETIKSREIYEVTTTGTTSTNTVTVPNTLTGVFKYLPGRSIKVNNVDFTIVSANIQTTSIIITLSGTPVNAGTVPVIISKDTVLETSLNETLSILNTINPNDLSSFEVPTQNDFFAMYETLSTILIQHSGAYNDTNTLNTKFGTINTFIGIDIINKNRTQIMSYKTELQNMISFINDIHNQIELYYNNIKELVVKYKVQDMIIAGKNTTDTLNTRTAADKIIINNNVNYYNANGKEAYNAKRMQEMKDLKIQ